MATTKATTLAHTLGGISSDISTAEINRLDGVTGDLQTQLNAKAPTASPTFTGTITAPNDSISGDSVSGGTIGAGTFNGTIGDGTTFNSKYVVCTKIFSFWHSTVTMGIVGNNTGTEVLSTGVGNATFANSIYLISCSISYNLENCSLTDYGDFACGAWLQNSDNSKNYRFGVYRGTSWTTRHSNMETTVGNFWLSDTDGGHIASSSGSDEWNQTQFSVSDVGGKRQSNVSQNNVASNFSAGEALTLKVVLGSHSAGINYNSAHDTETDGRSASKSYYCIKEFTQVN